MSIMDFLFKDKSRLKMMEDENRRLIHEIANLRQREMLSAGGMTEHRLRGALREVLAEELQHLSRAQLEHWEIAPALPQSNIYDGRNGNGYQPIAAPPKER